MDLKQAKCILKDLLKDDLRVKGVGIGEHGLKVYVSDPSIKIEIPETMKGIHVDIVISGDIKAI